MTPPDVAGHQEPRIFTAPPFDTSAGQEAVELAAAAGLELDPWQQLVLRHGMGETADGMWSAYEVAVNVPRQNGKGGIIEARELAGLFLLNEQLIVHSAHEFKTSMEAFRRVVGLIENSNVLRKRVKHIWTTTGKECVELKTGQRLRFMARSGGAGRGFTADCVILDEAMILGDTEMGAIQPTLAAIANPQLWYLGSSGVGAPSVTLGRLRRRALDGGDDSLAYLEWSILPHADECMPDCAEHDDPAAPTAWARANPAMGIRISQDHIRREHLSMSGEVFGRERLGVGEYPSDGADAWCVIGEDAWRALADPSLVLAEDVEPLVFAVDVTPDRAFAAVGVACPGPGETTHVEVVDHRPGTAWVVDRVAELVERWRPAAVVVDQGGPAGSLISDLEKREIEVTAPKVRDIAAGCGQFYDSVVDRSLVHLDQAPLATALAGAEQRPLGDAWAWARRNVSVDISPLMAVTLAAWGFRTHVEEEEVAEPWVAFR